MRIVIISPEDKDPREVAALQGFFEAGLERYHVRKPAWPTGELEAWIRGLPQEWRPRLVVHRARALAQSLGLAGCNEPGNSDRESGFSRSCHTEDELRRHLGSFSQLLFGPVFHSISKPGYGPGADPSWTGISAVLRNRPAPTARVLAIGGITADRLDRCHELGFDGAAVMGAVWNHPDPVRAAREILARAGAKEGNRHAA